MASGAISAATKTDYLALDKARECDMLAEAAGNVLRHYGDIPGLNQKTLDWVALFYAVSIVAGPRVAIYKMRRDEAKPKRSPAPPVVQATTVPPASPPPSQVEIPGVGKVDIIDDGSMMQ